jgi:hypothetical protein
VREALNGLTEIDAVFLKLAWFFEDPEQESLYRIVVSPFR